MVADVIEISVHAAKRNTLLEKSDSVFLVLGRGDVYSPNAPIWLARLTKLANSVTSVSSQRRDESR
jgi:hypothetical protein